MLRELQTGRNCRAKSIQSFLPIPEWSSSTCRACARVRRTCIGPGSGHVLLLKDTRELVYVHTYLHGIFKIESRYAFKRQHAPIRHGVGQAIRAYMPWVCGCVCRTLYFRACGTLCVALPVVGTCLRAVITLALSQYAHVRIVYPSATSARARWLLNAKRQHASNLMTKG